MNKAHNIRQSFEINAFDALIDSPLDGNSKPDDVCLIDIERINPAVNQPRKNFSDKKLQELANSFQAQGFKGAINVRPKNGNYEIVAGERRYRAAKLAGLDQVRCIIDDYSDEDAFEFAMRENLNRENLSKLEEVEGVLHLIELKSHIPRQRIIDIIQSEGNRIQRAKGNVSLSSEMKAITEVLAYFGMELETFRSKYLKLLNLPDGLRAAHLNGSLGYNHALELSKIDDPELRKKLLSEAVEKKYSVRALKALVRNALKSSQSKKPKMAGEGPPSEVVRLWNQLKTAPIWNDATIMEPLIHAMQQALGIEPEWNNHST